MSTAGLSPRIWPTVAAEVTRYWMRRNRALLIGLAIALALAVLAAIGGMTARSEQLLGLISGVVPMGAGLVTMSGIVADDRASGLAVMWFQKPGHLWRAYGIRYAIYLAWLTGFAVAVGLLAGAIGGVAGLLPPIRAWRLPLVTTSLALIPAAIVFAFSAWGARRDAAVALVVIVGLVMFAAAFAFDHGAVARILKAIAPPMDAIEALGGSSPLGSGLVGPLLTVTAYFATWTAVGFLGLRYTQRSFSMHGG